MKKHIDKIKKVLDDIDFDYNHEENWAYQYRNCSSSTKAQLRDFLNRVVKPEIFKRIKTSIDSHNLNKELSK